MYKQRNVEDIRTEIIKLLARKSMPMLDIMNALQRGGVEPISQTMFESVMNSLDDSVYWNQVGRLALIKG